MTPTLDLQQFRTDIDSVFSKDFDKIETKFTVSRIDSIFEIRLRRGIMRYAYEFRPGEIIELQQSGNTINELEYIKKKFLKIGCEITQPS